ncbi:MAG: S8 family peptidase [Nitrosomonadaceae bacterium]|nr:S8 family peptidase [Nitrosomonadaceae bacterium]
MVQLIVPLSTSQQESPPSWGLDRIDQTSLPLDGIFNYSNDGSGVTAYIIDTGILTTHSEFQARASIGYDAVGDGKNGVDCNGHGTHVAGTVGGINYGVAKDVNLVAVRVLNCSGSGTISGVISGVDWVTKNKKNLSVANMSLGGGGGASTALDTAVSNSIKSGITYAIAAGNSSQNACNFSPARVAAAITVGATDAKDTRPKWSNYGKCLDLFAPGVSITSSWIGSDTATKTISGTSMATPHVTGVVALILQSTAPEFVITTLKSNSTKNVVISPGLNSPNQLLFTNY